MFNGRIDALKKALNYMDTEAGWADWCNMVGDHDAWEAKQALWAELDDLFEAGYYGTEEARYVIGEA